MSNRFREFVRFPPLPAPISPGIWAVSMFSTGKFPAPPVTWGMPLRELKPTVLAIRISAPPLKACCPFAQLKESAKEKSGVELPLLFNPGFTKFEA